MPTIKVIVEGRPNAGKTTVALIIEKALKEAGFKDVIFKDELEGAMTDGRTIVEASPEQLDKNRAGLAERLKRYFRRSPPIPTIHIVSRAAKRSLGM